MMHHVKSAIHPIQTRSFQRRTIWPVLGRILWVAVFAFCVWTMVSNVAPGYERLSTICTAQPCPDDQLTPEGVEHLAALGLSVAFYAWYTLILTLVFAIFYWMIGLVIFWRRADEPMALYTSLTLILFGTFAADLTTSADPDPVSGLIVAFALVVSWIAIANLLYIFPDGRFVPRWTVVLLITWLPLVVLPVLAVLYLPAMRPYVDVSMWPPIIQVLLTLVLLGGGVFAQIYRYRRVSTPAQRYQTKWVVYGLVVGTSMLIILNDVPYSLTPQLMVNGTLTRLLSFSLSALAVMFMGATIAIAILRYRLWDIDVVIRRTLIYAILSTVLALVYFGSVLFFESIRSTFWGERSQLETILSTLLITGLVAPLRRMVQDAIDRRLYRRKYNAEQVVATLSAHLQREVELERLRSALLHAVAETWQPAHVSFWSLQENSANQ
ncbi:MAG: hypothetical protein DCC55_08490 [Chloroflexi bacterium]|nr:MAG: hypothetical protein DCC55_08490 [Chloroflexota bacterium]